MKFIIIKLIQIYQVTISPLIGANCRYSPTCSNYCIQSLKKHGLLKGLVISFKRICSCHPWGGSGYDPVP
tara:strand:- start:58 stop:267 length:210 start_codon:yes stop_codon:yes gene_type:complete